MSAIPEVPANVHEPLALRRFLTSLRATVAQMAALNAPPQPPGSLQVTPVGGGNQIQFVRSQADGFTVFWSPSANFSAATGVDIGMSCQYVDQTGAGGVTRYYWVQGRRNSGVRSTLAGPVAGTSLAPGTSATLPAAPQPSLTPLTDERRGKILVVS